MDPFVPGNRFRPAWTLAGAHVAVSFLTRLALLLRPDSGVERSPGPLLHVFGVGLAFDLVTAGYLCLPVSLWFAAAPDRLAASRGHRRAVAAALFLLLYGQLVLAAAEWVFWDEFGARFNFIAVDYLAYTREVLGNARESYPVGIVLSALALPAVLAWLPLRGPVAAAAATPAGRAERIRGLAPWIAVPVLSFALVTGDLKNLSPSDTRNELAGNGLYEFFAALRSNGVEYERAYATAPPGLGQTASLRTGEGDPAAPAAAVGRRVILAPGPERRLNVVLVTIESMGAEFLSAFGSRAGLTPELDALAERGLLFTNVFATGNRTVRGLEALSLSIPPTPGPSIFRRPGKRGLSTLGATLRGKGYDTLFLYGGHAAFDDMADFFSGNGYRVVDRSSIPDREVHHENVWGVADEDLYALALRELDRSWTQGRGRPFFAHLMTTTNHRPYTYPEGRIDIPPGTGRAGAVKYSDHALGVFLRAAASRPWFRDTVFVITADHGASARGTTEIPVDRYRIPLIVWSPKHVKPGRVDRLASQIDVPPTVLGLLNSGYSSAFLGHDLLRAPAEDDRAYVANHRTLGYLRAGRIALLEPNRKTTVRPLPRSLGLAPDPRGLSDAELLREAMRGYETASRLSRGLPREQEERTRHAAR